MSQQAHTHGDEACGCGVCVHARGLEEARRVIAAAVPMRTFTGDEDLGRYAHLHCHSNLSFKDSINNIEDMVRFAKFQGQKAIALTDHGHMFGAVRLGLAARDVGIWPIFGMEAYEAVPYDVRLEEEEPGYSPHLTLLVMDQTGWVNLCAMHTLSYMEPYAYRSKSNNRVFPRIDRFLLERYNEGLICMSACLGGKVAQAFMANPMDDGPVLESMAWYRKVFGDRYYVELMANTADQKAIVNHQRSLCRKAGVPVVPTNDVHYLQHWLGVKGGPHNIYSASRWGPRPLTVRWQEAEDAAADGENNQTGWYGSDGFFLKSANEMIASGFTEAELRVSTEIAARCIGGFDPTTITAPMPPAPLGKRDQLERTIFEGWRSSPGRILK